MSVWIQLARAQARLRGAAAAALLAGVCGTSADPGPPPPVALPAAASTPAPDLTRTDAPPWVPIGEQLRYRITWGFVPVGEAQSTTSWVEEKGRRLLALTYRARSNSALRQIYPVDDTMVTLLEPAGFRPVVFRMDMKEGSHIRRETTTFDFAAGKAVWTAVGRNKTREIALDRDARDLLSLLYAVRQEGFTSGSNRTFRALINTKIRDVPVVVGGHEAVKIAGLGAVDCLRVSLALDFEGFFVGSGKAVFWSSTDARHLCMRARVSIPVGSITAELIAPEKGLTSNSGNPIVLQPLVRNPSESAAAGIPDRRSIGHGP